MYPFRRAHRARTLNDSMLKVCMWLFVYVCVPEYVLYIYIGICVHCMKCSMCACDKRLHSASWFIPFAHQTQSLNLNRLCFALCLSFGSVFELRKTKKKPVSYIKEPKTPTLLHIWPKHLIEINQDIKWTIARTTTITSERKKNTTTRVTPTPSNTANNKRTAHIYKWCVCIHFRKFYAYGIQLRLILSQRCLSWQTAISPVGWSVCLIDLSFSFKICSCVCFTVKKKTENCLFFFIYKCVCMCCLVVWLSFTLFRSLLLIWSFGFVKRLTVRPYLIQLSLQSSPQTLRTHLRSLIPLTPPHWFRSAHMLSYIFCSILFYNIFRSSLCSFSLRSVNMVIFIFVHHFFNDASRRQSFSLFVSFCVEFVFVIVMCTVCFQLVCLCSSRCLNVMYVCLINFCFFSRSFHRSWSWAGMSV